MITRFLSILILTSFAFASKASDLVFKSRVATVLNTVTLYPDTSYYSNSDIRFSEGELLEVLGESVLEHLDDSENQKFKWFKVRSQSGQEGWIYGDGIAVVMPNEKINEHLLSFHKKKITLNNGFEKSVTWMAAVQGRDNLHDNDFLNPTYHEYYLVITNEFGKSVHVNYESQSAMGRTETRQIQMIDVTGDQIVEVLLQTSSYNSSSDLENRTLEIFSLQSGTLKKVLEERMTLTYDDDLISPAMFKFVEINNKSIRIEFIDFLSCKKSNLDSRIQSTNPWQERCLEYVTYTYVWDTRKKNFEPFYKENRIALRGVTIKPKVYIFSEPSFLSKKVEKLEPKQPFKVIKYFEKITGKNERKKLIPYLYVQTANGNQGYLRGKDVILLNSEHAPVLNNFFQKPPLSKSELKTDKIFLKVLSTL